LTASMINPPGTVEYSMPNNTFANYEKLKEG
jgi:hypothetical protein